MTSTPQFISITELRRSFDVYFADIRSGKTLIITRRGVPFARFEPVDQAPSPRQEHSRG